LSEILFTMWKRKKSVVSFTVSPKWLYYLSLFAKEQRRNNSNMLEVLIEDEYNRRVADGEVIPPYSEEHNAPKRGEDKDLEKEFEKFAGGKK